MKLFPGGKFCGMNCRRGEENIPHSPRSFGGTELRRSGPAGVAVTSRGLFWGVLPVYLRVLGRWSVCTALAWSRTLWGVLSAGPHDSPVLCQAAKLPCLSFPISKRGGDGDPPISSTVSTGTSQNRCGHPSMSLWWHFGGTASLGSFSPQTPTKKIHLHPWFPFFLCQY